MKPSVFLGRICITWGIVTMATAAVKSYGGLIAARIALGIAEAGFFPGCLILLTYVSFHLPTRMMSSED